MLHLQDSGGKGANISLVSTGSFPWTEQIPKRERALFSQWVFLQDGAFKLTAHTCRSEL